MVAGWAGYQEIVYFSTIQIGEEFASTKSGRHYRKITDDKTEFVPTGRRSDVPEDVFEAKTLVYRNPTREDAFY